MTEQELKEKIIAQQAIIEEMEKDFQTIGTTFLDVAKSFDVDLKNPESLQKISIMSLLPKISMKIWTGGTSKMNFTPAIEAVTKYKHLF